MLLAMLLSMLPFGKAMAKTEAYAVYTEKNKTLTFYYDDKRGSRPKDDWWIYEDYLNGTDDVRPNVDKRVDYVEFDPSFAKCRPKTLRNLFSNVRPVEITGMEDYLNTSMVTDMNGMFAGCSALTDIDLSGFETSKVTDMSYMFNQCASLESIDLSDFDLSNVTTMRSMFSKCESLKSIDLSDLDAPKLENMRYMCYECKGLESVDLSDFDTPRLKDMSFMFMFCYALKNLNLRNFKTGTVTYMNHLFVDCTDLTSIDLSGFDTRNVTSMNSMFVRCGIESIDLSGFDTRNVTDMSGMFENCNNLLSLDLSSFDTRSVTDMSLMFMDCQALTSIELSGFDTRNVTDMAGMFDGCWALKNVDLSNFDTGNVEYMGSMFFDCRVLENLDLRNFNTGNVVDMSTMFRDCWKLKSIDVSSFDTHNVRFMNSMFSGCSSLTELDLSSFDMRKVAKTNYMFYNSDKLKKIYVANGWQLDSLDFENSKSMFYNCVSLVGGSGTTYNRNYRDDRTFAHVDGGPSDPGYLSRKLSPSVYAAYSDGTLTFYYDYVQYSREGTIYNLNSGAANPDWYTDRTCMEVSEVVFDPSFKVARPNSTHRWFAEMMSLSTITGLEYLNTSDVSDMYGMFFNCRLLKTLDLTGFNTANVADMSYMFYNCSQLTTILIGEGWSTAKVTAAEDMFLNCTRLVGAAGTAYDSNYTGKSRARADGGTYNPGYLSLKEAYVAFDESEGSLTFYCDTNRSQHNRTFGLNVSGRPSWEGIATSVKMVVFDKSFAYVRPTSTYCWFYGMSQLKNLYGLGDLNTSEVTDMGGMFYGCRSLTYFDLRDFDVRKVTNMSSMFYGCTALKFVYLPAGSSANTNTSSMFSGCSSLESVNNLSEFDTSNVTFMGSMFSYCSSLTSLDVSTLNTANVTKMNKMFMGCSKLTSLNLINFDTHKVTDMEGMFQDSYGLKAIYVGNNWNTETVTASSNMFAGCTSLVGGAGTAYDASHVDKAYAHLDGGTDNPGYMSMIAYVAIDGNTMTFSSDANRKRHATTYDLDIYSEQPTWIEDSNIGNITRVIFDPTFAMVRPTTTARWFEGMAKLETVTGLEYLNTSNVTDMNSMFRRCNALKSLDVSRFDTRNVTNMSYMFGGCDFESIDVNDFDTRNVTQMAGMFASCVNVTAFDLTNFNTKKVESFEQMFENCQNLTTIYVGKNWSTERMTQGRFMFRYSYKLVGGAGTTYNDNNTGATYAHVDGGTSNPGYLTLKEAYAVGDGEGTLTFYCDNKRSQRTGTVYDLPETGDPGWKNIPNVVFDPSFASARPVNTRSWFYFTTGSKSIEGMEYLNTSMVTDMYGMFALNHMGVIDVSNFDTRNVKNMTLMFACDATVIYAGERWSTENVTESENMFLCQDIVGGMGTVYDENHNDKEWARLDGGRENPGYFTEKMEAYAVLADSALTFYYDKLRNSRTGRTYSMNDYGFAPDWLVNAEEVKRVYFDRSFGNARPTSTNGWFWSMKNLETISDMEYLKTDAVTDMSLMFGGTLLETLDLSGFNVRKVTNMSYMFFNCSKLKTITVNRLWSPWNVTKSDDMFTGCKNLVGGMGTTYDANHVDAEYALVDNAPDFPGYLSLKKEPYAELAGGTLTFRYDGNRTARYSSRTFDLNKADESPAWHYHPSTGEDTGLVETITAVVFDPSFAEARPTSCSGWFSGMTNLQSITGMKEYLNTNRVEHMAFMFANCSSLESLDLSAFYTNNVKTMYGMFRNCSALQTLDVTKLKTGRVESMFSMFEGCSSLTSLDVSRFNTRYVTSFESMFENCYSLKTLDLSAFDTHNVTNMMRMFIECQALSTIVVGDKWTMENVDMENYGSDLMFYNCYKLVGGAGTTYAEWRVDGRYAHIDGGDDNPGYFTAAFIKGDVNNDGQVGIGDIVAITNVMAGIETDAGIVSRADVNADAQVGIGDIVAVTNIMAGVQ